MTNATSVPKRQLTLGERKIGPGEPTFIIAEISNNHNGSVGRAHDLVDVAAAAGADAVKFQKRTMEELYTKDFLDNPNKGEHGLHYMVPLLQEFELSMEQMRALQAYCEAKHIMFMVTPWDLPSADFVESLNVPIYKIGSPDLTNMELIEHVAGKGMPIIISTGMSVEDEVVKTLAWLEKKQVEYAVLHCNSTYPAPVGQLNLRYIERLQELTSAPVGFSGHELGVTMGAVAVALGATILERHITLDHDMEGPDHAASLEPEELRAYIKNVRDTESALGSKKKIFSRGEVLNREVLGKSLAARVKIPRGTVIGRNMVQVVGPGRGLSPQHMSEVVGAVAERDFKIGDFFTEEFLPLPAKLDIKSQFTWGFKGRFGTIDELVERYRPQLFEFHMSDEDAHAGWMPEKIYAVRLIAHATEYLGRRLVDLCAADADQRRASRELVQATIDKTRALAPYFKGRPAVIVHVGGMSVTSQDDPKSKQKLLDTLKRELEKIKRDEVDFYLENLPPRPWYFGGQWIQNVFADGWEIAEFLRETGYDFCFDTSHAQLFCNLAHKSLADYAAVVQPWTRHLHVSDAIGIDGEGLQIGDGEIDWETLFRVLRKNPCGLIPEVWRGHLYHNRGHILGMERLAKYIS